MNELQPPQQNDICVDRGLLVSLHDGELTTEEEERANAHIALCPECAAYERSVRAEHQEVATLLALLEPVQDEIPDTASAFARFQSESGQSGAAARKYVVTSAPDQNNLTLLPSRKPYRRKAWLIGAVAAILVVLLLLPNASALASQFLALFSVQQFQPVSVDPQEFRNGIGEDLQSFGNVNLNYMNQTSDEKPTQAQVQQTLNFKLLLPGQLLPNVSQTKQFNLVDSAQGIFTFDAAKARTYLAQTGQGNVSIPPQLDGATYTITLASGVIINYGGSCQVQGNKGSTPTIGCSGGKPLYIAEIPSPVIQANGKASLEDLRNFIISLPKLSPEVRLLIKDINLQSGVIPLPIPPQIQAQQVSVQGASGVLMTDPSLSLGGVLWQKNGIIYALAGEATDSTQLLDCANSFH